jgi:hypothetical protein
VYRLCVLLFYLLMYCNKTGMPGIKKSLLLISVRGWVDLGTTVRPERCQWKIPTTSSNPRPSDLSSSASTASLRTSLSGRNGTSKIQAQKFTLYLLGGLPWDNGWNLGYIPFTVVLMQAYEAWNVCGWTSRGWQMFFVFRIPKPALYTQLTHGQHSRRRAHRLQLPKHCGLISVTEIKFTWQKHRMPSLNTSQLFPSVEPPHNHPVITSHYTTPSSLENVVRLVSFITGEVCSVRSTYLYNYVIARSLIKKVSTIFVPLKEMNRFPPVYWDGFWTPIYHTSDNKLKLLWESRNSCSKAFGITRCCNTWVSNPRPTSLH